jgi:hypothetical protein
MVLKDIGNKTNLPECHGTPSGPPARKEFPKVGPTFNDVLRYASTPKGIDPRKMQELEGRYGYNGGVGCDVLIGPCSCGAWH